MSRVIVRRLTAPSSADPVKDRSSLLLCESLPDHPHPVLSQHCRSDAVSPLNTVRHRVTHDRPVLFFHVLPDTTPDPPMLPQALT